jgi:hypothetical protein
MATKKKTKSKQTRSKSKPIKSKSKSKQAKSKQVKSKSKSKRIAKKAVVRKKSAPKKLARAVTKAKAATKKTSGVKSDSAAKPRASRKSPRRVEAPFLQTESDSDSAGQSGDLQGLSNIESADSESVDELIEEGNAFEAGVVSGVEEAGDRGVREVRTREVPEDDVPGEYLDEE